MHWWQKAVFYQIYPRSFMDSNDDGIGDLPGIISKLDYLNDGTAASLGVDALWFNPFFPSPQRDFGYDVSDYCNIDPAYGTLADFDRLVEECRRRGMRVILDLVVNHSSADHPWFLQSRSSHDNPKRDWYIWRDGRGARHSPPNNWRNHFFGPAWTWDEATGQYYLHSFLKEQPDLNWSNPEVREAVHAVIRFWLERGASGFRLDVPHVYCKDEQLRCNPAWFRRRRVQDGLSWRDRLPKELFSSLLGLPQLQVKQYNQHRPGTHQVLKGFRRVFDQYPETAGIGEIVSDDPLQVASYYGDGDELHLNFYFNLLNCRWSAGAFRRCIDIWERLLSPEAWPAYTFSNHDRVRAISRYHGDGRGDERARLLALLLLTLRGTPFIYYGEEIGMLEGRIPREKLRDPVGRQWYPFHKGRDGCRTPMQWEKDGPGAGFTAGEPWLPAGPDLERRSVAAGEKDPGSLLHFYRKLIWRRKELPALLEGSYRSLERAVPHDCYLFLRERSGQRLAVALNYSTRPLVVNLSAAGAGETGRVLLSTRPGREGQEGRSRLDLAPLEGCLLEL